MPFVVPVMVVPIDPENGPPTLAPTATENCCHEVSPKFSDAGTRLPPGSRNVNSPYRPCWLWKKLSSAAYSAGVSAG